MRAVRVDVDGRVHAGVQEGVDGPVRVADEEGLEPIDLITTHGWEELDRRATRRVTDARLLAPVARPGKILCIGLNYADHLEEQRLTPPERPVVFTKFATSIVGPGDPIPLHAATTQTDYEAELAVVIGRRVSRVDPAEALPAVAGYTIINDVTARDLQATELQWARAKGADGYAPMGPALVSPDEFGTPEGHAISCRVNGELRQDSSTSHLLFDVPALIAYITEMVTLEPGDVIATGTPGGVGHFMDPPQHLRAGDEVAIHIAGIGSLVNPVSG